MENLIKNFERIISYVLIAVGMVVIVMQTLDMLWLVGERIVNSFNTQRIILEQEGHPIAEIFFNILLTFEVMQTVRVFAKGHIVKIRIILLVCLIAVARKILMLDMEHPQPIAELAVAGLILALAVAYYFVSKSESMRQLTKHKTEKADPT